jgi:hypothetical protein
LDKLKVIKTWDPGEKEELTTKELTEKLIEREGISAVEISPEETVFIRSRYGNNGLFGESIEFKGPATIIINQD